MSEAPEKIWAVPEEGSENGLALAAWDEHKQILHDKYGWNPDDCKEYIRADLAKPKVKTLVWDDWDGGLTLARTPFGKFILGKDCRLVTPFIGSVFQYENEESAKAAAQADYERRILEALDL